MLRKSIVNDAVGSAENRNGAVNRTQYDQLC